MLKNIDPILTPELLAVLMEMGHEDAIVVADANFTAARFRAHTAFQKIIRMPGLSIARVSRAVLSVLPLGIPDELPVRYMHITDSAADHVNQAQQDVIDIVRADPVNAGISPQAVERFAFYELAKQAHVIIQTGDLAPYANFMFKKGVITHHAGL
jgi:L-fucose mutarotase